MVGRYLFRLAGPGIDIAEWLDTPKELDRWLELVELCNRKFANQFSRQPMQATPRHLQQWADDGGNV